MRASMARFSTAGVPKSAGAGGALARSSSTSPTATRMPIVRALALNSQSQVLSFSASSMGKSLLSTDAKSKKKPSARGRVAAASAPGEAEAFLRSEGLSPADIAAISAKYPQLAMAGVDTVLRPKISLLKKEAGLADPTKLGAVLSAQPRALLTSSLDRHLKPTVAFFTTKADDASGGLGMRRSTLARIAAKRPILLTYDVGQLLPKVEFFGGLGLTAPQIRQMVAASPDVLSIGIGNDLQPTVHWIRSIGIDGKDLANLLAHHPTIFHNPLMVAQENVKLLKGSGGDGGGEGAARGFPAMRLSDAQAAGTMLGAPVLFRRLLTTASMRAKLRYWGAPVEEGGLGRGYSELAAAPRFLERALKVTAPRLEFAKKISSGSLPRDIAALLEGSDGAFATEKLGAPGEAAAFEAFKVEWEKKNGGKWGGPE